MAWEIFPTSYFLLKKMALDQIDVDNLPDDEREMSFFEHIEELRWHIMRSLLAITVITIIVFCAKDFVFNTVIFGPRHADFPTYKILCWLSHYLGAGEKGCVTPIATTLKTIDMAEAFTMHFTVSIVLGFIVAFPYIFWEFWRFIRPGLRAGEANTAQGIVAVCSGLFFTGVAFGYFVIAPSGINFLMGYALPGVENDARLGSYINYMILFVLPSGLTFELPLVVYFLAKLGIVSSAGMREYRRYAIVITLIVAAIITPGPDVMSQMLVGVPLYLIYEASVLIAAREERKRVIG
jgi:sec-independent protein translocase protein TatC